MLPDVGHAAAHRTDAHRSVDRLRQGLASMASAQRNGSARAAGAGQGEHSLGSQQRDPLAEIDASKAAAAHAAAQALPASGAGRSSIPERVASRASGRTSSQLRGSTRGETVSPSPVMTSASVLRTMSSRLSEFEQSEILDFKQVYFVGRDRQRKVKGSNRRGNNAGYDDDRANYRVVTGDHIAYRYEIISELGSGSFGIVMRALDHKTGRTVALKIIRNKRRFHRQAKIEVDLLRRLREADSQDDAGIIHLHDWFTFRNHLCITFPMLGGDLYGYLKKRRFKGLPISSIRRIAGQVFRALEFIWKRRLVHCDIKPENLLLCIPSGKGGDKYRPCGPKRSSTVRGVAHRGMSEA